MRSRKAMNSRSEAAEAAPPGREIVETAMDGTVHRYYTGTAEAAPLDVGLREAARRVEDLQRESRSNMLDVVDILAALRSADTETAGEAG